MLLFRSEEHVDRWCRKWRQPRGEIFSLEQQWRLAQSWYGDRLQLAWRRKTPFEAETLFAKLGLTSPFWDVR